MIVNDKTKRPNLAELAESYAPDRRWNETDLQALHYEILKQQTELPIQYMEGWSFRINRRAKSRLGCCKFGPRVIEISGWVFDSGNKGQIVRTLAHEMAHMVTRREFGHGVAAHGREWKAWARKLGHHGNRCDGTDAEALKEAQVRLGNRHPATCRGCGGKTTFGPRTVKRIREYGCRTCKRRTGRWEYGLWVLDR